MEFQVNVTLNLGAPTIALLSGIIAGFTPKMEVSHEVKEVVKEADKTAAPAAPAPAASARAASPARTPAPARTAESKFTDLNDTDKLDKIKDEVTRHTKNKKGSDIKFMLAQFDADRASNLSPECYDAFYEAIQRYGKGEAVTDIFQADDNLD